MDQALTELRNTDWYRELVEEGKPVVERIKRAYWQGIVEKYNLGWIVKKREMDGLITRTYREATITMIAEDWGLHYSVLYRILMIVEQFPTLDSLVKFKDDYENKTGRPLTYTYLRDHVLPNEAEHPDKFGGADKVAHSLMNVIETMGIKAEELKGMLETLSPDEREQAEGVIEKARGVKEDFMLPNSLPRAKGFDTDRDESYLDWVRSEPCLYCKLEPPSDPHHCEVGGIGLKGSDYLTIPVCRKHHNEVQNSDIDMIDRKYGVSHLEMIVALLITYIKLTKYS